MHLVLALLVAQAARADARYEPAMRTAEVGLALPVAGAAVLGGALLLSRTADDADSRGALATAGIMLSFPPFFVGPALAAGGALRAQRALSEEGVAMSRTPGLVAWGSYGLMFVAMGSYGTEKPSDALRIASYVGAGAGYLGAYGAALTQYAVDRKGSKRLVSATIVPMSTREATGFAVCGRY